MVSNILDGKFCDIKASHENWHPMEITCCLLVVCAHVGQGSTKQICHSDLCDSHIVGAYNEKCAWECREKTNPYDDILPAGMDSSGDSEDEDGEEREEVVQPNQRCVETLTDTLHSMTLQSPVCHPERPTKVYTCT